jgi:predicted NAD/FAD-dependent oxidoreductase
MRVGIVGAGLAGLLAGRQLQAGGHEVVLFDKGRSAGGRLSTRRIGVATLDHGAQFFTVRNERFATLVHEWEGIGLVREWCRGFGPEPDGHPRYAVRGGMNALAKHLATGLDVRTRTLAFALRATPTGAQWSLVIDDGTTEELDAAIITCPVPQARSLVLTGGVELPPELRRTDYDRTLALLTVLDRPGAVPPPGGVQDADETFGFVGDNEAKGVSAAPAITFHARAEWSLEWWDRPREKTHAELRHRAARWLGNAEIMVSEVKRWRFATPQAIWPDPCWVADGFAPLVFAGDAFAGPRVEGAGLSGLAAADALS